MEILYTIFIFTTTPFLIFLTIFLYHIISTYIGKSINNPDYPPVRGTVYGQLFYFNKLYEYHTEFFRTQRTYRLLASNHSNVFIADPRNVEHILKTKFEMYSKGKYNKDITSDVFGEGIFLVDGDKWRQQRKLASFEFSSRVLRDFSCAVFRRNAAKLVRVILQITIADQALDMQVVVNTKKTKKNQKEEKYERNPNSAKFQNLSPTRTQPFKICWTLLKMFLTKIERLLNLDQEQFKIMKMFNSRRKLGLPYKYGLGLNKEGVGD